MVAVLAACSAETSAPVVPVVSTTVAVTTVAVTTVAVTTVAVATTAVTTTAVAVATTAVTTTAVAPATTAPPAVGVDGERVLGSSALGEPITAVRRGEAGGRVVLVIGVIHGDEPAGAQIVDELLASVVPPGIDLWLVRSMNPDGFAANDRHNGNQVDLNRNFPADWAPLGVLGDGQYAGPSEASEPETQAMVAFIDEIRPDLVIWYHQDLYRISPGKGRDGAVRARYAELVGLPVVSITGGTYTGVAATWARRTIDPGVAFIVELGPTLSDSEAAVHAQAVLTLAGEPF